MRDAKDNANGAQKTLQLATEDGVRTPGYDGAGGGDGIPPGAPVDPDLLDHGSDVEIARRLAGALRGQLGEIHWCEGQLWFYQDTHWVPYPEHDLRLAAHRYDGVRYYKPGRKNPEQVQLGRTRINSILGEFAVIVADPEFFAARVPGINCRSGFIRIGEDGAASIEAHNRAHRSRHVLPGHWMPPEPGEDRLSPPPKSLLGRLVYGSFAGDPDADDKISLVAETVGAGAAGIATLLRQPRAVILYGFRAENGKTTTLDLCRAPLPGDAVAAISPAKFGDEHYAIGLRGVLLNAADELSTGKVIASDAFKTAITGGVISGRALYRDPVRFSPVAQHVYAVNILPPFTGGIDRGVERRVLPLVYQRVIPLSERIPDLGRQVAEEEPDLLLAFSVAGASRLRANGVFTMPPSSAKALRDWLHTADPVRAWVWAQVTVISTDLEKHWVTSARAYEQFVEWARGEGFRLDTLPAVNGFVQRVKAHAPGVDSTHKATGNRLIGIRIGSKRDDDEE